MTDSFKARTTLKVGQRTYEICGLDALKANNVGRLPFSLKILLENLLRFEDGVNVKKSDIDALLAWDPKAVPHYEIAFTPARVIMQDFTGVPCIVDLAAMREAIERLGGDPQRVNPLAPAELVIDHSVQVDEYGTADSLRRNNEIEFSRNGERYMFLRWGQTAFSNFKVVPPNTGIVRRSTSSGWRGWCSRTMRPARLTPTRTRWSEPTRTPPWSTGSAYSAGASAASRPRPPCWASRSPCSFPRSSVSNSRGAFRRGPPRPISS